MVSLRHILPERLPILWLEGQPFTSYMLVLTPFSSPLESHGKLYSQEIKGLSWMHQF
jgi:hypothetical protein